MSVYKTITLFANINTIFHKYTDFFHSPINLKLD